MAAGGRRRWVRRQSRRADSLSILVPCSFRPFGVASFSIVFLMPDAFALALGLAGPDDDEAGPDDEAAGPDDEDAPPVPPVLSGDVTKIEGPVSSGLVGLSIA